MSLESSKWPTISMASIAYHVMSHTSFALEIAVSLILVSLSIETTGPSEGGAGVIPRCCQPQAAPHHHQPESPRLITTAALSLSAARIR